MMNYSASIGSFFFFRTVYDLLLEHIRKKMKREIREKFGQQQSDYIT
jgi:hypothetical protein